MVPWSKEGTEGRFDLTPAGTALLAPGEQLCRQLLPSASTGVPGEAEAESSCETEAEERAASKSKGCTGTEGEAGAEAGTGGDTCVVTHADNKHLPKNLKTLCSCGLCGSEHLGRAAGSLSGLEV